jgi:hypothetical protein
MKDLVLKYTIKNVPTTETLWVYNVYIKAIASVDVILGSTTPVN